MLTDESIKIKMKAINWIKKARNAEASNQIRQFIRPKEYFNMNAKHYSELIDWKKVKITEPPLTMEYTLQELKNFEAPNYDCHSQSVERVVALVSRVSKSSSNLETRMANALVIQQAVTERSKSNSKIDLMNWLTFKFSRQSD